MILICICCTCCNACASGGSSASSYEERNTFIPVAVPAEGNPPPTAPGASYQYSEPRVAGSGSGPFGGGWGSALGGFALGQMMGSAFGGGGNHHHHRHGRRHHGGGGFDIRGDTGGGGHGGRRHHGGGFGFGGGGGGGHNIRGDS